MGRKAGRAGGQPGARRGRDRSPRRSEPPSDEPPSPSMRQLAPVRAACVFSTVARPSSSPPPPMQGFPPPAPRRAVPCAGVHLLRGRGSPHAGVQLGSERTSEGWRKWVGDGLALFPLAVSHSRQPAAGDM